MITLNFFGELITDYWFCRVYTKKHASGKARKSVFTYSM